MPRPVHFEIPSENPDRSIAFWSGVFGWQFNRWGDEEYWLITTGADEPGIDGGLMTRRDPAQPVVNTICIDNLDAYAEKVTAAGGQIVVPKMPVPTIGWLAYFKDPDGNIFGMMQNDPAAA